MYKCAICGKELERDKVKKMIGGRTGKPPDNKQFKDIILENIREDEFHVLAEFVRVIN